MDKLKYVKLEQPDGSYSNSIPLAVDADHVDVNGSTLTNVLGNKANINDINNLKNEIAIEKARIDNITQLEEGSTTGDAELQDIRVGADNNSYNSAGNSIRTQITNINNNINSLEDNILNNNNEREYYFNDWEIGGIHTETGQNVTIYDYQRTKYFKNFDNNIDYISFNISNNDILVLCYRYNENNELIDYQKITKNNNFYFFIISKYKYRFVATKNRETISDPLILASEIKIIEHYKKNNLNKVFNINKYNLIKPDLIIKDYLIEPTGKQSSTIYQDYYQYIAEINDNKSYYVSYRTGFNIFLDEDKRFIAGFGYNNPLTLPFSPPENAKYIITSISTSRSNEVYVSEINNCTYSLNEFFITPNENINEDYIPILKKDIQHFNKLNNKIIACLGDSITSTDYVLPNWLQIIENRTNCRMLNYGISGTTLAHTNDRHLWDYHFTRLDAEEIGYESNNSETWSSGNCFCERYTKLDDNSDVVIVMGGTNDHNVPIGLWDSDDPSTFYGALNILFKGLINKFPGKPILICTMIQSKNIFQNNINNPLETLINKNASDTLSLQLRAEAIKVKAKQYSLPCLDLYNESGINGADNNAIYYNTNDTLHPSAYGQLRIANLIENKLLNIL